MSVYTPLDASQMSQVLRPFGFTLVGYRGASHGIENSTFLIEAEDSQGQPRALVLTVFESLDQAAVRPYLHLLSQLATDRQLPVPGPLNDDQGQWQISVAGKPAVLMPRLPGEHDFAVDDDRCRQVGALLARLHQCDTTALLPLPNERQRLNTLAAQLGKLPQEQQARARALLSDWQASPVGATLIHGDLFRDNLLWQDGKISALLDFYNACLDDPEYDLAVTLNDWCVDSAGQPLANREQALLEAYRANGGRINDARLTQALAVAALRFWLSRLAGPVAEHSEGQGSKDPEEFARIYGWRVKALNG
ncbi:homoserine kinase [Alcanivorax sediminis]|uniref:Homoserine kinase n=1 Tax=Alcanivorax sediminis TaxID=2663008 RepID=A0A6N7LRZ3_9GAMM|nr:homoserine kinase [Alcanivorax sediminis]MQX52046.1 phosphotransferase [Alcanivorax sediminis]